MLDIIGTIALTSGALLVVAILAMAATRDPAGRRRLAWIGGAWFVAVASLAAMRVFSASGGIGTLAIGAAVVLPILAALLAVAVSPAARSLALGIPTPVLVGLNAGRLIG